MFFAAMATTSGPRKKWSSISRPRSWMEGKLEGLCTLEFRLVREILAGLLKHGVPALVVKETSTLQSTQSEAPPDLENPTLQAKGGGIPGETAPF